VKANSQKLTAKALTVIGKKEGQSQLRFGAMALFVPLKTAWEHSMALCYFFQVSNPIKPNINVN